VLFNRQMADDLKKQKDKKKSEEKIEEDEEDEEAVEEVVGSKTIVIHPGSKNLRIGLASHAFPKTVPNVVAHRQPPATENGHYNGINMENGEDDKEQTFITAYNTVYKDFRERMRFYKRRIIPNSHELVMGFNGRQQPEAIADHNDPYRVEWTDVNETGAAPAYFTGTKALNIPPDSNPSYTLRWPIRHGVFNEQDYGSPQDVLGDIAIILVEALEQKLRINVSQYSGYNVVLIIPDLYDKVYVNSMIQLILNMGFANVCIQQEAIAATFGAGISTACIIDVGAEKTSITCVEDGMCISDSRVNVQFGGDDVTRAFAKLLLRSNFPYSSMDINRTYDWQLAEELKRKFVTTNDADVTIQLYAFFQRAPGEPTRRYEFKTFDEVMVAPLGLFYPQLFDIGGKLSSRYRLFSRSEDIYDGKHNDPMSDAQINIAKGTLAVWDSSYMKEINLTSTNATPGSSMPGTPVPEPKPAPSISAQVAQSQAAESIDPRQTPCIGLDHAIIECIEQATKHATTSAQAFYESLMIVGGGASKFSGFNTLLTDRIAMWRDNADYLASQGDIAIMPVPREIDPEVITWKGGSVYAKLKIVNEMWISAKDWDLLGSRALQYKALFMY
jgi:actin-related protein 8